MTRARLCRDFTVLSGSSRDSAISRKLKWSLYRRNKTIRYLGDNFSIADVSICAIPDLSKSSWGSGDGSARVSVIIFSPSSFSNSENGIVFFFLRKSIAVFFAIAKIQVLNPEPELASLVRYGTRLLFCLLGSNL